MYKNMISILDGHTGRVLVWWADKVPPILPPLPSSKEYGDFTC